MFAVQRSRSFGGVKNNDIVYNGSSNGKNGDTESSSNGTGSGDSAVDSSAERQTPKNDNGGERRTPNLGSLRFNH